MTLVQANGTSINFEEVGMGESLLLLHPLGGSTRVWQDQMETFAPHYRTIAVDVRGHGKCPGTARTGNEYSIQLFADDLAGLVEALGIEQFHLLGASMGGMIAMRYAHDHSEKIGKLVLVGSYASKLEQAQPDFEADWSILREHGLDVLIQMKKAGSAYFGKPYVELTPAEQRRADIYFEEFTILGRSVPDYIAVDKANLYKPDQTNDMETIREKLNERAILLYGEKDFFAKAQSAMQRAMGARRDMIPNAGHLCWINNPEVFNRKVYEFLQS